VKRFRWFVTEMAAPTDDHKKMTFYHGVSDESVAHQILKDGHLKGRDTQGRGHLAPMKGHTYVTPHLHYAQIYALGGDTAGSDHHRIPSEYGHIFGVSGHHLKDIHPDEDSLGSQMHDHLHDNTKHPHMAYYKHLMTPNQHRKVKFGEYSSWAQVGKKLNKHMSNHHKIASINQGAHIAHNGNLPITHAWRIHKDKVKLLNRDGSNFHDHAEKIL
jgi:hypothetical protein